MVCFSHNKLRSSTLTFGLSQMFQHLSLRVFVWCNGIPPVNNVSYRADMTVRGVSVRGSESGSRRIQVRQVSV